MVWFGAEYKKERVKKFYALLTPAPYPAIEAVAMDIWDNFTEATSKALPNAAIVSD